MLDQYNETVFRRKSLFALPAHFILTSEQKRCTLFIHPNKEAVFMFVSLRLGSPSKQDGT